MIVIALRQEDKVLPASLVRECLEERLFQYEQAHGRPAGRKKKSEMRDSVLQELVPKALVRSAMTYAALLPAQGWLIVDAGSAKKADMVLEMLHKTVGTFSAVAPSFSISDVMTRWMMNSDAMPPFLALGDICELKVSGEQAGVIRCHNIDIASDEVRSHVRRGAQVSKLALQWQEQVSFVLHDDVSLHRLRFDAALQERDPADDPVQQFDADAAIMAETLNHMLPQLFSVWTQD